jgi:hypothetical protein|tara:strand:- start:162 stop:278 length:117 start_codon:yes stop_codon:yes gene_type:complete
MLRLQRAHEALLSLWFSIIAFYQLMLEEAGVLIASLSL